MGHGRSPDSILCLFLYWDCIALVGSDTAEAAKKRAESDALAKDAKGVHV